MTSTLVDPQFTALTESDIPEEHRATWRKYRHFATAWGADKSAPVCYRVGAGFTLVQHAPRAGVCEEDFKYLRYWDIVDSPTEAALVFWIPCLVPGSTSKHRHEQVALLDELRSTLGFPAHHLTDCGQASLIAGLMLSHLRCNGTTHPLSRHWIRTDSYAGNGFDLKLRWVGRNSLWCDQIINSAHSSIGVVALGMEPL